MRRKTVLFALSLGLTLATFAHRAAADYQPCTEGSTIRVATGMCCTFDRELYETWQCQEGLYSPNGQYSCGGICVEF